MRLLRRLRLLRSLGHDQTGLAVPTALMALLASFGLASVAVIATVNVQTSTKRDHSSKEAIAAADAGANVALLRLNRFASSLANYQCVSPSGQAQNPTASGWCPTWVEETAGGAAYKYAVSAYGGSEIQLVSVGTAGGVSRRVNVSLILNEEKGVYEGESLIGEKANSISGSSAKIAANVGTNGGVHSTGNAHPEICANPPGTERVGPGEESVNPKCGQVIEGVKKLPPVSPPADIATVNSNCRLAANCSNPKEVDTVGSEQGKKGKGVTYNAATRELTISASSTLTMGGTNYFLCKLTLSSGTIYMVAETEVRIYLDTPEHCGYSSGATQLSIEGKSTIRSSAEKSAILPAIYMIGNGGVVMNGNGGGGTEGVEMMLYAPLSNVEMKGTDVWRGAIAAREINLNGSIEFISKEPSKAQQPQYEPLLSRSRYVECGGGALAPGDEPNSDC